MKSFKQFYVWAMNAKFIMGLYFIVIVFFTGVVTALYHGTALELLTLLEMLGLSVIITILQILLLENGTNYSKGIFFWRSVCWLIISVALTVAASILFRWFAGLPTWCPWLLAAFMVFGLTAMLVGLKWEQEADTVRLNTALRNYKQGEGTGK